MVPSHSMISTGTIPVEHKSVHWLSMGATSRNHPWGAFQLVFFKEWSVTNSAIHKADSSLVTGHSQKYWWQEQPPEAVPPLMASWLE